MIEEEEYASGNFRVTIVWDQWDAIPTPDRTSIIRRAYEKAEPDRAAKIALASGWTVPEAHAAGWLPYQIIAAHRATDPVTPEQCRDAMIMEGASGLLDPKRPQLRFATLEEAEAAIARLSARLPGSEPVWVINQELVDVAD